MRKRIVRRALRVACALASAPAVVVVPSLAVAQPSQSASSTSPVEGNVVAVEKDDLVLDVGTTRGALEGDELELWRPLRLKHPVTGKMLMDRFLIGKLRLVQARPALSLAAAVGGLSRAAEAGDVVVLSKTISHLPSGSEPQAPVAQFPSPAAATSPGPAAAGAAPPDDDAKLLSEVFDSLRGADLPKRVRAYESYVYAHPQARYVNVLWEEARALRKLLTSGEARTVPETPKPVGPSAELQPFDRVVGHQPLRLAVTVHGDVLGVVLHSRTLGQPTYSTQPMDAVGAGYYAATIPGDAIRAPGLQYFVEAVSADGQHAVVGHEADPRTADVQDVTPKEPTRVLGQAQIWTDYASFNAPGKTPDYVWQTEGVMGGRFGDEGIRALRTGFGVYRGVGGTLHELDDLGVTRSVGLTYGYLETEFGFARYFSLAVRGIVGLREDGVGGGGSAFFRIGSDLETNLLIGGELLGGIGVRGITQFEWNSFRNFPIVLRTEVTNQPAGVADSAHPSPGDIGARAIAQVGYRVLPHLVVSARGSYQGRTINHAGPGAGAAVGYAW